MSRRFLHNRTALAEGFRDALLGRTPFSHESGLFLAGPRRTGKSTFLRQDLIPALEAAGTHAVYVDLWSDRSTDPGHLIADALRAALRDAAPAPQRLARKVGLDRIRISGVELDLGGIGEPGGSTLGDALGHLHRLAGKPLAMIVDEAQHALSSQRGIDAMFALKAARDALNQSRDDDVPALMLVFTGSHRDKLIGLLRNTRQPFFGASVTDMPLLDRDYVTAYVGWLNGWLAPDNQLSEDIAFQAFALLGHRPELLAEVLRDTALGPGGAAALGDRVLKGAAALRDRLWAVYDSDYGELSPVQRAVLAEIIARGAEFQPYVPATLAAVSDRLGAETGKSTVQSALNELRDKGLVWQSGRGQYALEDQGMTAWLAERGVAP